ncbi:MAG: hypothetical protein R6W99_08525, partial [Clostridia bacterium]
DFKEIIISEPKDHGYNPDNTATIGDENVRAGIIEAIEALSAIGNPMDKELKISDMFELIYLDFCPEDKEPEYFYQTIFEEMGFSGTERHVVRINNITGLDGLQYAKNLMFLYLPHYNISDLSPISGLDNLLALWIDSTTGLSNIDAVENLTNLRYLVINNLNSSDISPISNLQNLGDLSIVSHGSVNLDLTPLNGLGLSSLSLHGFNIEDWEPIGTLWNLHGLHINASTVTDLTPLKNLSHLGMLNIRDTAVSDIGPLAELQNLRHLTLENCSIESIEGLQNLVNLQEFYLDAYTYDKNPLIINAIKENGCNVYRIKP